MLHDTKQYPTIPKYTLQTLHQLIPFSIANILSIICNIRPFYSWYCHNTVLTVFCQSGIAILILANLQKTFMLSIFILGRLNSMSHCRHFKFHACNQERIIEICSQRLFEKIDDWNCIAELWNNTSLQYSTDSFLSIWYHRKTDSGKFAKIFDAWYIHPRQTEQFVAVSTFQNPCVQSGKGNSVLFTKAIWKDRWLKLHCWTMEQYIFTIQYWQFFCQSGTNGILILANLQKTLMLSIFILGRLNSMSQCRHFKFHACSQERVIQLVKLWFTKAIWKDRLLKLFCWTMEKCIFIKYKNKMIEGRSIKVDRTFFLNKMF